jgi:chromosome segregation ATPase
MSELDQVTAKNETIVNELMQLSTQKEGNRGQLDDLSQRLKDKTSQNETLKSKLKQISAEKATLEATSERQQTQLKELTNRVAQITSLYEDKTQDDANTLQEYRTRITKMEADIKELETQKDYYLTKCEELQAKNMEQENRIL